MRSPPTTPTADQKRSRLLEAAAAWVNPPTFEIGQLVQPAPFICDGKGYSHPGDLREGIVLDTVPSLRKFLGDPAQPNAQGVLVAFIASTGDVAYQWIGAWQYVPANFTRPGRLDA